ncbi:MAG: 2-oxo-4-hydroxy-4-carboxy-5-ureidoimidazoline decarboxylase [Rhizobiales bacterium]|nr:2-oxo-4-hydroxy-4-carboxy-5-ureidoimidazoline decarboxylase [Hyphomicrobiales bacterium]
MLDPQPSRLNTEAFVAAYGAIYEHSPWVAEQLAKAGLSSADDDYQILAIRMAKVVDASTSQAKLALLNAHPQLVTALKAENDLAPASRAEQSSAGLDQCTAEEFQAFSTLNELYRTRFGFPFIIAVRGLDRPEILQALRQRVENSPEVEFTTALGQVHRIAQLRLEAMDK